MLLVKNGQSYDCVSLQDWMQRDQASGESSMSVDAALKKVLLGLSKSQARPDPQSDCAGVQVPPPLPPTSFIQAASTLLSFMQRAHD